MPRTLPWRNACPTLVVQRLQQLASARLLLIHEKGPTSFVLKDANSSKKFTVGLGDVHSCTCVDSRAEMCLHILYVLQKVFRIPAANPLLWQRSFMDAEVHDLVIARNRMRNLYRQQQLQIERDRRMRRLAQGNLDDDDDDDDDSGNSKQTHHHKKQEVERKILDGDDTCPICCDSFNEQDQELSKNSTSSSESLVWCRFGCGNSIHLECFRQYCQHHATRPEPLACPLCRTKWGQLEASDFGGDLPKHASGTKCDACRSDITYGERFRCCYCPRFDLCPQCYNTRANVHAQHPFDVQSGPGARFVPAPPRPLPLTNQQHRNQQQQQHQGAVGRSIGEIFNQHSPTRNGNNNNSAAAAASSSSSLTLNDALRFSLPFDEAVKIYMEKYFGISQQQDDNNEEEDVQEQKEEFKQSISCPICLENFIEENDNNSNSHPEKLILLPTCKHIFHLTCATQWMVHGGANCAFCKLPVSTVMLPSSSSSNQNSNVSSSVPRRRTTATSASTAGEGDDDLSPRIEGIEGDFVVFPSPPAGSNNRNSRMAQHSNNNQNQQQPRRGRPTPANSTSHTSSTKNQKQPPPPPPSFSIVGNNPIGNISNNNPTSSTPAPKPSSVGKPTSLLMKRRTSSSSNHIAMIRNQQQQLRESRNNNNDDSLQVVSTTATTTTLPNATGNSSNNTRPRPKPSTSSFASNNNNNKRRSSSQQQQQQAPPPPTFSVNGKGGFTFFATTASSSATTNSN